MVSINDVSTDILGWEIQIDSVVHCGGGIFCYLSFCGPATKGVSS